jgi:hypothetical protein
LKVPGVIYRLGRKPDPWSPPDWASAGPDGTFGNRFTSRASRELDSRLRDEVRNEIAQLFSENVHIAKGVNQEPRSWRPISKIIDSGTQYNSGIGRHFEVSTGTVGVAGRC